MLEVDVEDFVKELIEYLNEHHFIKDYEELDIIHTANHMYELYRWRH